MLRRRPKELFEVMGSHAPHEGAISSAPQARKRAGAVENWGGAPIVVLSSDEDPAQEAGEAASAFDELIAPRSLADEETQNLPAVGQKEAGFEESVVEAYEVAAPVRVVQQEPVPEQAADPEAPRKRRFVSLDTPSSQRLRARAAAAARPTPLPKPKPAAATPKAALAAPIPPNATGEHPSTWVGELAMWGSQTLRLRRDTLLVALAILGVSLLLAFLFGQKLGEMAAPAGSALQQLLEGVA